LATASDDSACHTARSSHDAKPSSVQVGVIKPLAALTRCRSRRRRRDSRFAVRPVQRQRRADAGLGWLTVAPEALPPPLEEMSLGDFEPDVLLPPSHPAASRRMIGLGELARMDVIHGPRRLSAGTYDAWLAVIRECNPRFGF